MSTPERMSCCPPTRCALTPPGEYTKKGEEVKVANPKNGKELRYYKVSPEKESKVAILMLHDIFGMDCGRHFGVADSFMEATGATVIMPDLFRGDTCKF